MTLCCGILTIETSDCFLRSFCTIGQNGAFSTTEQINKFFRGSFQLFFGQSGFHFSYSSGFVCFIDSQIRSYFILIFTVFFFPLPSVAIAVIFTVFPLADFFVVTIPLAFTVAYLVLPDIQRSFLFAFFVAVTLAFSFSFFPAFTGLFPVILTFFTMPFIDVIFQEAYFLLPSFAVAVIVTFLPPVFFFRVTIPLWVTVATFELLDFQISFLLDALFGKTVAFKVSFLPAAICLERPERRIEVTFTFCVYIRFCVLVTA